MKYEGQPITAISFEPTDQPLTSEQLARSLPFKAGSTFHEHDLREAIENLFETGRFSDLAVDAREAGDGVALKFITKRAYFVGRVIVSGVKPPPNGGQLASATKLRLGTPYTPADTAEASDSLKNLLRQNGFYRAGIDAEVEYRPEFEEANVRFEIDTGKRARFEQPAITGAPERTDESIVRATHWKRLYGLLGWQDVTEARVRQGLDNVRSYYEKRDLLESRVTLTKLDYRSETNTVRPSIEVEAGPRIVIRVTGASISKGRLRQLVPVYQERSIDTDLLVEGQHNIEQYMESEGYFGAEVTYRMVTAQNSEERTITYQVSRGSRHKFVYLGIKGNHYFPPETVRERLYLQPAEFPRFPYGRYSDAYLRQDIQSIQNLYSSNGFRDVKVTSKTEDDYRGAKNHLAVFITIEEGQQWFVSGLSIEGPTAEDLAILHSRLASFEGQPFSEANVAGDRENFLNYYYDRGYLNATFDYYVNPAEQPNHVNIRYVLHAGPRKYVRDVLVSGLETTRRSVVYGRIELKKESTVIVGRGDR